MDAATEMLLEVIAGFSPESRRLRGRLIHINPRHTFDADELRLAVDGLSDPTAASALEAETAVKLFDAIQDAHRSYDDPDSTRADFIRHVEGRWSEFAQAFAARAIEAYYRDGYFDAFPRLLTDPQLFNELASAIANPHFDDNRLASVLRKASPANINDARRLIAAYDERRQRRTTMRGSDQLGDPLFRSIGHGLGWNGWSSLQAIVVARPDYADPCARFDTEDDPDHDSYGIVAAKAELGRRIEPQTQVRHVSQLLLELLDPQASWAAEGLLGRPAEVRVAYVDMLRSAIGDNSPLRHAAIELLLWRQRGAGSDLAQFAAVALARPEDSEFLSELEGHPEPLVRFAARSVRAAKRGGLIDIPGVPSGGLVQSLVTLEGASVRSSEPPRTWIGDREVELLIERTIAGVESRVAGDYDDHGDEGEDRLLSSMFTILAERFSTLDQALEALASAASAPYRASVSMTYRNVDRAEEGREGIKGAKKFAADLCLIIDPVLNDVPLGRRVILIQAKRLYRHHEAEVQPSWYGSFAIDRDQLTSLKDQTHSSAYFFFGPLLGGRGVPVIPTLLVDDLASHQGSGTQLARNSVAVASRSLADWLTYDAFALRTGDKYEELVERAEGRPGSRPRGLLDLPTVEVQLAVGPRSEER